VRLVLRRPDVMDARYGPHERHVLDLWKAKGKAATPVLIYFHGGGFRDGDKSRVSPLLVAACLQAGISVATANYRFSQDAPYPAPMRDGARAVQFLRFKAGEWRLDPARIAAAGHSAGAGMALWIAFHDDLAQPDSDDPVARQSSRVRSAAVFGAQSTYDPRVIKKVIGGRAHEHPALLPFYGLKPDEVDTPRAHRLYEDASPVMHLSADDPPVWMFYSEPDRPLPRRARPGQGIHHPRFGSYLKAYMDGLKIPCVVRHRSEYRGVDRVSAPYLDMAAFLRKYLLDAETSAGKAAGGETAGP